MTPLEGDPRPKISISDPRLLLVLRVKKFHKAESALVPSRLSASVGSAAGSGNPLPRQNRSRSLMQNYLMYPQVLISDRAMHFPLITVTRMRTPLRKQRQKMSHGARMTCSIPSRSETQK